jgi:DNA modification methylase
LRTVPTVTLRGLSPAHKLAYVIADNKLGDLSNFDFELLHEQVLVILEAGVDIEITGFRTGEADLIIEGQRKADSEPDPQDEIPELRTSGPTVSVLGDCWLLGPHRLLCSSALDRGAYRQLLGRDRAQMIVTDPPYNVAIQGHAMGRGRIKHREFVMASGEMSDEEFQRFLASTAKSLAEFSIDGSIHYIFMDWRHYPDLLSAVSEIYYEQKNLLIWNKTNAGQGSFYRSQHELIAVFKNGEAPHINNFGLGGKGRYRTNVIDYPGVNGFHPSRAGDLEMHPTVKPIGLIADLIRDCSKRDGLILDVFGGSGTTLLAAERTGRRAAVMELDPGYVDVEIRRFERITGTHAIHAAAGDSFEEVAAKRLVTAGDEGDAVTGKQKPAKRRRVA